MLNSVPTTPFVRLAAALVLLSIFADLVAVADAFAVFKSTDRGQSWVRSNTGMPAGSRINAFGSLDEALFAGTDSGIFNSKDEARSWQPATGLGVSSGRIISFAALDRKMFAGTDGHGLLVSSDQGTSWVLNTAFPSKKVRCLLADEGKLYAGADAEGVFVSTDAGVRWAQLRPGLPAGAQVFALAVVQNKLFAGLYSNGLYTWNEQDHHWKKAGPVFPLVLASTGGTLVAGHNPGGLYWSGDFGVSWSKATARTPDPFPTVLWADGGELSTEAPVWELASNHDLVFAGASAGIYYSEDHGHTWARARAGLPAESPGVSFLVKRAYILAGTRINAAKATPDPAANGNQPVRSETNQTTGTAGSRR